MPVINKPNQHFDINLYSGNSGTQTITNSGLFQPDFVWSKCRNVGRSHRLCNSVGGSTKEMYSDSTANEQTDGSMTSFTSTGFNLNNATGSAYNTSGENYVSWQWKAGGTAVTNTSGTISSQVSANPTAGFSIVTYTGNGTSGATVGHGLGVTPSMVILKPRPTVTNWQVKHSSLNANQNLNLNLTAAVDTAPGSGYISAISSTTLTLLNGGSAITNVNGSGDTYVAYCFAQIAGYSAFGSYTGNGSSDGPFVYTGFRPRFVMWKNSTQGSQWILLDTARNAYNVSNTYLEPNTVDVDNTASTVFDILSNGFKLRNAGGTDFNENANIYIYMAFAEAPFKYSSAR